MDKLKKSTKDLMGVGITGMAGLGAMGAMSSLPGMPKEAAGVSRIAGVGVQLGAIGGLVQITKNIVPQTKKKTTKKKR